MGLDRLSGRGDGAVSFFCDEIFHARFGGDVVRVGVGSVVVGDGRFWEGEGGGGGGGDGGGLGEEVAAVGGGRRGVGVGLGVGEGGGSSGEEGGADEESRE